MAKKMRKTKKKTILLGLTGSIAAYKTPFIARELIKRGFNVFSIMTENARKFTTPFTMEALTGNPCFINMFHLKGNSPYPHIALSKKADIIVVAPATANFIAKAALGIADDLLTTIFLACDCPRLIAPAMNVKMYNSLQTRLNIKALKEKGVFVLPALKGSLACGDTGTGRMAEPGTIIKKITAIIK